jgi:Kef-type K+ transport system membrane component KefB
MSPVLERAGADLDLINRDFRPKTGIFGLAMRGTKLPADADLLRSLDQAGNLLLPLFFVVSGLSLNVGSVHSDALILLVVIFVAAVGGKLGPAYAVSRLSGLAPRDSATVAALVNTTGLTELIALNVGLQAGLIDTRLFTVLVLIAFITTLMTGPLLSLIRVGDAGPPAAPGPQAAPEPRTVPEPEAGVEPRADTDPRAL